MIFLIEMEGLKSSFDIRMLKKLEKMFSVSDASRIHFTVTDELLTAVEYKILNPMVIQMTNSVSVSKKDRYTIVDISSNIFNDPYFLLRLSEISKTIIIDSQLYLKYFSYFKKNGKYLNHIIISSSYDLNETQKRSIVESYR